MQILDSCLQELQRVGLVRPGHGDVKQQNQQQQGIGGQMQIDDDQDEDDVEIVSPAIKRSNHPNQGRESEHSSPASSSTLLATASDELDGYATDTEVGSGLGSFSLNGLSCDCHDNVIGRNTNRDEFWPSTPCTRQRTERIC